jgi:hypothetical protein
MKLDLATLEGQVKAVEAFILAGAVANFERDGSLNPISFLFVRRGLNGEPLSVPIDIMMMPHYAMDPDMLRLAQQRIIAATDAAGIVYVAEVWYVEHADAKYIDCSVAPKEHPDRKEAIYVMLHHPDGAHVWRSKIERPPGGPPVLGEFESKRVELSEGRMSHYFPTRKEIHA